MIRDRRTGNEIRVVAGKDPSAHSYPATINEFFNGINTGFIRDGIGGYGPHVAIDRLYRESRITEAEHDQLMAEVAVVAAKALGAMVHPSKVELQKPVRVPDLKGGNEFSLGTDGHGPVVIMHHKDTNDFVCSYVNYKGDFTVVVVLDGLYSIGVIDIDGRNTLHAELSKVRS